jgi:tetratricopeptide (TPR) repeat protein
MQLCANCGAKNRPGWRLCQRCRCDLREPVVGRQPRRARWVWAVAGGVIAVAAFAIALPGNPPAKEAAVAPPRVATAEADLDRPRAAAPAREVVMTPVTREDFARAGEAAYAQGSMSIALSAFEGAVAAFPDDAHARNNLGQLLVRLGRAAEALPHLQAAAETDPGSWTFRFNLARARGFTGDWEGAVADYRTAGQLFPDDHATLYNLGRALQKLGDHGEAVAALERAVALQPDEPSLLLTLASSYEKLSRVPDAIQAYRQFLDRDPQARDASAIRQRITRLEQVGAPGGQVVPTSDSVTGERAQPEA